jgi:hypothetical protein
MPKMLLEQRYETVTLVWSEEMVEIGYLRVCLYISPKTILDKEALPPINKSSTWIASVRLLTIFFDDWVKGFYKRQHC